MAERKEEDFKEVAAVSSQLLSSQKLSSINYISGEEIVFAIIRNVLYVKPLQLNLISSKVLFFFFIKGQNNVIFDCLIACQNNCIK